MADNTGLFGDGMMGGYGNNITAANIIRARVRQPIAQAAMENVDPYQQFLRRPENSVLPDWMSNSSSNSVMGKLDTNDPYGIEQARNANPTANEEVGLEMPMLADPYNYVGMGLGTGAANAVGKFVAPKANQMLENYMVKSGMQLNATPIGKPTAGELAQKLAHDRAMLPVSEHGLGLPAGNTAMDRANVMFPESGYHGSLNDINKFTEGKASTESHAGRGTYITDSPEDASMNYANIWGPDVKGKVERHIGMEMDRVDEGKNSLRRLFRRFHDENLTPRQQEILLANTTQPDNLGVVYPLRYRADKPIHLDFKNQRSSDVGPFTEYDKAYDEYIETPEAEDLGKALREYESAGGDTSHIHDLLGESYGESVPAVDLYKAAMKGSENMMDEYTGDVISGGVAGSDFVKHLGVDQISHTPTFRNQQLNLGSEHTVAMNPDNIRSRFAAFDPWRRNAAIAALTGTAAPDLMAGENDKLVNALRSK